MTEKTELPAWEDCMPKADRNEASALERFIYDNEPAGTQEEEWRQGLQAVIAEAKGVTSTDGEILFYGPEHYVLSNFSAFRLKWRGIDFDTSEHAYHFEKFGNDSLGDSSESYHYVQRLILSARSAHEAFKLAEAHRVERRTDWDQIKVDVMRRILRAKAAQHEYVRRKLLETGDRALIEDSWRDDYWGWGPNRDGQNMLGKLWMEIRAELRA